MTNSMGPEMQDAIYRADQLASLSRAREVDLVHICYGGLSGQMDVVNSLNKGFASRGLRTAVLAIAKPTELLPISTWTDCDRVEPVLIRRRGDLRSMTETARLVADLRGRAILIHSHRHAIAAHLGGALSGTPNVRLTIEATSLALRSKYHDLLSLSSSMFAHGTTVLTTKYRRDFWLTRIPTRGASRTFVTPNGVDTDAFAPVRFLRNSSAGELVLGMAGRLVPGKDFPSVVRAVSILNSELPDVRVRLLLAGSGPRSHELRQLVSRLQLTESVELLGLVAPQDMPDYFRRLDAYVHASDGEGMSTAILQAAATGLPVVASDVSGVTDVAEMGLPLRLVPAGSAQAIAEEIRGLLNLTPEVRLRERGAMREAAVDLFSLHAQTDHYLRALSVLDPGGPWKSRCTG